MSQLIDAKRNEGNARVVTMVRAGFSREALLEAVEETDKVCARMAEDERLYAERERAEQRVNDVNLLESVLAWAADNPKFDSKYVSKLQLQIFNSGTLTDGQRTAVENIIEKWRIEIDDY